jgi:hypothetical protein
MESVILFKGEIFEFLRQFSLSKNDLITIATFVFIRNNRLQFIALVIPLPFIALFITSSYWIFIALLLFCILNGAFAYLLHIYVSFILTEKVFKKEKNIFGTIIQIMTILLYMVTVAPIIALSSKLPEIFNTLYHLEIITNFVSSELNILLSLFPVFANGFFTTISLVFAPELSNYNIPIYTVISSLIGLIIFLSLIILLVKKSRVIILSVGSEKLSKSTSTNKKLFSEEISLRKKTPIKIFVRSSIKMAFRDFGSLSYMIPAIMLPLVYYALLVYSYFRSTKPFVIGSIPLLTIFFALLGIVLISIFLNISLSSSDDNLESTLASIPYDTADLFRSRQIIVIAFSQIPLSIVILYIILMNNLDNVLINLFTILFFLSVLSSGLFLLLKSYLFGRLNNRYTLMEINNENKILKTIGVVVIPLFVLLVNYLITDHFTNGLKGSLAFSLPVIVIVNVIFLAFLEILVKDLFSLKKNRMIG